MERFLDMRANSVFEDGLVVGDHLVLVSGQEASERVANDEKASAVARFLVINPPQLQASVQERVWVMRRKILPHLLSFLR